MTLSDFFKLVQGFGHGGSESLMYMAYRAPRQWWCLQLAQGKSKPDDDDGGSSEVLTCMHQRLGKGDWRCNDDDPVDLLQIASGPSARNREKKAQKWIVASTGKWAGKWPKNGPKTQVLSHFQAILPIFWPLFSPLLRWGENPFFGHSFTDFGPQSVAGQLVDHDRSEVPQYC